MMLTELLSIILRYLLAVQLANSKGMHENVCYFTVSFASEMRNCVLQLLKISYRPQNLNQDGE